MSIRLMTLVWEITWPTQSQLLVALKLADHANDDGSNVYPAKASIARLAQCSESTVQNALRAFRDCGLLLVIRRGGNGPKDPTVYAINVRLLTLLANAKAILEGGADRISIPADVAAKAEEIKGSTVDPLEASRGQSDEDKGSTDPAKGSKALTPNHHLESSREPSLPPNPPQNGGSEGEGEGDFVRRVVGVLPAGTEHTGIAIARIATTIEVKHANPPALFAELADALKGYADPELDAIAREVIRSRKKVVAPKCVLDYVKAALDTLPVVTIREGDPRWDAWAKYHASRPAMLSIGRMHGFTVRSNRPPGWKSETAGGGP